MLEGKESTYIVADGLSNDYTAWGCKFLHISWKFKENSSPSCNKIMITWNPQLTFR